MLSDAFEPCTTVVLNVCCTIATTASAGGWYVLRTGALGVVSIFFCSVCTGCCPIYQTYSTAPPTNNTSLTTENRFGHICLSGANSQPAFTSTSGLATALNGLPIFNATTPILCSATVVGSATTAGLIDDIYDVRTFTSAMKEAVNASTALELGMLADAGTTGAMQPAVSASQKLYGAVVASNGATSGGAPNAIVTTVGPAWVKAIAGTAGQFVKTSTTNGFSNTIAAIPNNSFYYSVGNTRTAWSTTCTAANNCAGSLYINLIVR